MADLSEYEVEVVHRSSGAPRFMVVVWLGGESVGVDYAASMEQARRLGEVMAGHHQQLVKERGRWNR